jgi:C4-dicarboxylate transporter DctQ subunit
MNKFSQLIDRFEENFISILLGLMVLITFSQVVARYIFNTGWGGALELTQNLFAWLILFGMSYGIKIGSHLGVDILVRKFPSRLFRFFAVFSAFACILYGITFLWGDWVQWFGVESREGGALFYWYKIHYNTGTGMESIKLPAFLFGEDVRLARWVGSLMLPLGLALFVIRSVQVMVMILKSEREMIIASHEAEELLESNKNVVGD